MRSGNSFTIRVELHNSVDKKDYDLLHSEMEKAGYLRTISYFGKKYQLPSAEYIADGKMISAQDALKEICQIADKTARKYSVLITSAGDRIVHNLHPVT